MERKSPINMLRWIIAEHPINGLQGRAVQRALYLLFNEGYHGASSEMAVRAELCREAMRLTAILLEHPLGATPITYALAALMALHAARLPRFLSACDLLDRTGVDVRRAWTSGVSGKADMACGQQFFAEIRASVRRGPVQI